MKTNMRTKIVNHSPPFRRLHQGALFEPSSQIAEIETLVSNPSTMKFLGALLVNIARGGLLDYEAVHYHLKSGHLGGLGMDVAWTEPFDPDDPILKLSNVLITPHVAGATEHSYRTMAKVVGDVALQLHAGTPFTGIEFVN